MQVPVYILVPVFNRKAITVEFCRLLQQQTYSKIYLVLIDDGSTDGTAEAVQLAYAQTTILRTPGNCWWGGSLQYGYHWILKNAEKNGIVLIANDDMVFDENYIESGVSKLLDTDKTLLGSICWGADKEIPIDRGIHWSWSQRKLKVVGKGESDQINCLSTRGLFLKVIDFIELGGFYPKLLPHYLSDYEFTMRAYNRGYKLLTNETVNVKTKDDCSGITKIDTSSWQKFKSQFFSPRNYNHPVYSLTFIYLACPHFYWRWKNYLRLLLDSYRTAKPLLMQYGVLRFAVALMKAVYHPTRRCVAFFESLFLRSSK